MITVPPYALKLLSLIEEHNHTAWIVGGFVRDSVAGLTSNDIDMASSATWSELEEICAKHNIKTYQTGIEHGTLSVKMDGHLIEVTTYRTESTYSDKRHPDAVQFVSTIQEDVARRDFTINAMAYHPVHGLCDMFGGQTDLEKGLISCVGDPHVRFQEDPLRMLRALRFAATRGYTLAPATQQALYKHACLLSSVSAQRIEHEFRKLLCGAHAGTVIQDYIQVIAQIIPEAYRMYNFNQYNYHHIYDVLKHTTVALDASQLDPLVRYAVFFHDIGKPDTFTLDEMGTGHFHGHPRVSKQIASKVLDRLKISTKEKNIILNLVLMHDERIQPTTQDILHLLQKIQDPDVIRMLFEVRRADCKAHASLCFYQLDDIDACERVLDTILERHVPYRVTDLAITGEEVIASGISQGPAVGIILERLLEKVISGEIPNEKEALLKNI